MSGKFLIIINPKNEINIKIISRNNCLTIVDRVYSGFIGVVVWWVVLMRRLTQNGRIPCITPRLLLVVWYELCNALECELERGSEE